MMTSSIYAFNTPKELLKSYGIDYDKLPILPKKWGIEYAKRTIKKVALITLKMTVMGAVALLVLKIIVATITRDVLSYQHLSVKGMICLIETERKVRAIAKKAGIVNSEKIALRVMKIESPLAATGRSTLIITPAYLIRRQDLPKELQLARLDNKELTEEEWIVKFNKWVDSSIYTEEKPEKIKSQLEIDISIEYGRTVLWGLKNPELFEKIFEGVVGHELGHCFYHHSLKKFFAEFAWDLLALPTLGISTLFQDKVLAPLYKKDELEADRFSQSKFEPYGLIKFFKQDIKVKKKLYTKYPSRYDSNGEIISCHSHPSTTQRIKKLKNNISCAV